MRRAHPFHTVRACAANPLHRERLLPLRPQAPRARSAPVPTSILDVRHHTRGPIYTLRGFYPRCEVVFPSSLVPVLIWEGKCSCRRAKPAHFGCHLPRPKHHCDQGSIVPINALTVALVDFFLHPSRLGVVISRHRLLLHVDLAPIARRAHCLEIIRKDSS